MNQTAAVVAAAKRLLKRQGLTYRDVGRALNLSEPSIKRMFASGRLTVDRLAQVGELLGLSLAELVQEAAAAPAIRSLDDAQEAVLVADVKLLLTAVCALNHWTIADIVATYQLTQAECLRKLLQLDRLRLIDLLPGNRIRLVVARDFEWRPDGPIRDFFRRQGLGDFLDTSFAQPDETLAFVHGMLTDAAYARLQPELLRLRKRLAELHEESLAAPRQERRGTSLLLAARRNWEPAAFAKLRRPAR
ncbi:MAG TPA: helix-turn-helix domain-containing protein [Rhodocyclaceae bacterium]|nr:helix-turn-helix domain-containing protein [Rhodocyclaceae bacterium]